MSRKHNRLACVVKRIFEWATALFFVAVVTLYIFMLTCLTLEAWPIHINWLAVGEVVGAAAAFCGLLLLWEWAKNNC